MHDSVELSESPAVSFAGENEQMRLVEEGADESVIVPENPPERVIVMFVVPVEPRLTWTADGPAERLKSGGVEA